MQIDVVTEQDGVVVRIGGELQIAIASRLHSLLSEQCSKAHDITLDCTGVESIDTAILQILVAAKATYPHLNLRLPSSTATSEWLSKIGYSNTRELAHA